MDATNTSDLAKMRLVVYYLLSVKMVDKVPMLESRRKQAAEWLTHWTPKNNFRAIIGGTPSVAIETFRKELAASVSRHDYPPGNFQFHVFASQAEVIDGVVRLDWNAEAAARIIASDINAGGMDE
jgi:hypothetical protein